MQSDPIVLIFFFNEDFELQRGYFSLSNMILLVSSTFEISGFFFLLTFYFIKYFFYLYVRIHIKSIYFKILN